MLLTRYFPRQSIDKIEHLETENSWKKTQYRLTVDTVTEYELALPSGEVRKVTEQDEVLWFALKVCLYGRD